MKDTRIALCDARGPLIDVIEKCSGENGPLWLEALKKVLRKENPWVWKVWETINLGTFESKELLLQALKIERLKLELGAWQFFEACTLEPKPYRLELVLKDIQDLGLENFRGINPYQELCAAAAKQGLEICPDETAYQLALQCSYLDEPRFLLPGRNTRDGFLIPIRGSEHCMGLFPLWEAKEPERKILLDAKSNFEIRHFYEDAMYVFAGRKVKE